MFYGRLYDAERLKCPHYMSGRRILSIYGYHIVKEKIDLLIDLCNSFNRIAYFLYVFLPTVPWNLPVMLCRILLFVYWDIYTKDVRLMWASGPAYIVIYTGTNTGNVPTRRSIWFHLIIKFSSGALKE